MRYSPFPTNGQTFSTLEHNRWPALAVWRHLIPVHWSMCLSLGLLLNYRFCDGSRYLVGQVIPPCSFTEASMQFSALLDSNLTHQVPEGSHNPVWLWLGLLKLQMGRISKHLEPQPHCLWIWYTHHPCHFLRISVSCFCFPEGLRTSIVSFITLLWCRGPSIWFSVLLQHTCFHFEGRFHAWHFLKFLFLFWILFGSVHMAGIFSCPVCDADQAPGLSVLLFSLSVEAMVQNFFLVKWWVSPNLIFFIPAHFLRNINNNSGSDGKESAMQMTWVWSLGREDHLEKEMATHSSTLACRIPWATVSWVAKSRTQLSA